MSEEAESEYEMLHDKLWDRQEELEHDEDRYTCRVHVAVTIRLYERYPMWSVPFTDMQVFILTYEVASTIVLYENKFNVISAIYEQACLHINWHFSSCTIIQELISQ